MHGLSRTCDYCGERHHIDGDWVQIETAVVCYPCSIRDLADDWFAGEDAGVDPAEEREWDEQDVE